MPGRDETLSLLATRKELITLAYRMLELSGQESPPAEEQVETCTGPLSYEVGLLRSELAKGLDRLDKLEQWIRSLESRFVNHRHRIQIANTGPPV